VRVVLAAAVLALAAPGAASAAGLSLASQDLRGGRPIAVKRFDLVGLHWRGSGRVLFRTRSADGRWGRWQAAAPEPDDLPNRGTENRLPGWHLGSPYWTGSADALQYRTVGRVSAVRAFFVRGRARGQTFRQPDFTGQPAIITRAQWHAPESLRRAPPSYADGVHLAIVHHTVGTNNYSASQSASIVRAIMLYHVQGNGWNDIGYNFLVDKYGQVFEGPYGGVTRPVIGAHAMGFNAGSVGVAVLGTYTSTRISPAAKAALVSLLAWRLDLAHVDPLSRVVRVSAGNPRYPPGRAVTLNAISGHRDTYPTSCPGNSLYRQLPSIRTAVAQTGLPKIYGPTVTGTLGGPVEFKARLSSAADWTVTVRDESGTVVASGAGTGTNVDWTWDATGISDDQRYTWTIAAPDARSATGAIGTVLPPPSVAGLKVAPAVLTPMDRPTLRYRLASQSLVTATVLDPNGLIIQTLYFRKLQPAGPQKYSWSGISGVPDGLYRIQVVAQDARGRQAQASSDVIADATLAGFDPSAAVFSKQVSLRVELNAPAGVSLRIVSGGRTVATLLDGDFGAGEQEASWDGAGARDGRYRAVLTVTDETATVVRTRTLRLDRTPPVLRLISLRYLSFRLSEPARVTLVLNGRARRVDVRRPGVFHVGHRGTIRSLRAWAVDVAGNRSRVIAARR
jgi:N-acetylmuramoyl-L-alanine amidase-like protein